MEAAREIASEGGRIGGGPMRGSSPAPAAAHPLLTLQQQAGNHAVQELLRSRLIRAKLAISQPDDPEEREADEVSRKIMRSHSGVPVAGACPCSGSGAPCTECEQEQAGIHRQASTPGRPTGLPHGVASILRSSGRPLDGPTRDFFEPRFGRDLSHVRVHDGPEAASSARSIRANAYAAGSHIAFAENRYSPGTEPGRALLAHELAHTIQQQDQAMGSANRPAILREPANPPVIGAHDLPPELKLDDNEVALGPLGIAGPMAPGTVKDDDGLRIEQKDAEHVEIRNGVAWITITADPGAKYSYNIDPLIKRPEPESWMSMFDSDAPPAPPAQRVVRIVHSSSSEVRVDSYNPPAEVQQLVVHERYSSNPSPATFDLADVQERAYGKSSVDIEVNESAIRILTPEDRPVPAPPEAYPKGSRFAYSIEPDWTGPSATEKRVFIVASPGVQAGTLESPGGPAYTFGRKIVPVMIRVTDPGLVPEQGTPISPENFVSQEVYGEVDSSKTLEEQSSVLTASTGLSGVTISEPYSGARVTIRAWQPELGAAFAWQVVPAQGAAPGEIRIVAGPGTFIEFAEPVPARLQDKNGGATPTPLPKQARIGEGFSTSLRIVQLSDRGKVPMQGTPLNLDYYLQYGELRDPDEHEWLGTNDVPFMIADMFFHAIPVVGELLTIGDCASSLVKDEDLFGREVDKGGKILTCAMAVIGLLPFAIEAVGAKMTGGITAAESALKMARRIVNASKLGRSVEEVEVTLLRTAPLVRDAEESARLARASRAMENGEEILEEDVPAVRKALEDSPEPTLGGGRLADVTNPRVGVDFNPTGRPLEEQPGFAKGAVDKFQATGEVAPEVETAVRQRGGSWEEGRAAVQQTIKDAARDPAAGIEPAAAESLAASVPEAEPEAKAATQARVQERPEPPIGKLIESGGDKFQRKPGEALSAYHTRMRGMRAEVEAKGDVDAWVEYEGLMERLDEDTARLTDLKQRLSAAEASYQKLDRQVVRIRKAKNDYRVVLTEEEKNLVGGSAMRDEVSIEKANLEREIKGIENRGLARSAGYEYSDLGKLDPCFAPGTPVATPSGARPIESLAAGDLVLAWNPQTCAAESRRIVSIALSATSWLVKIGIGSADILATRRHLFWVQSLSGWCEAARLVPGQMLQGVSGTIAVDSVSIQEVDSPTVSLEVEGLHNFFVGEPAVLVHNGPPSSTSYDDLTLRLNRIYRVIESRADGSRLVIYVGKTRRTLTERFEEHLEAKPYWRDRTLQIEEIKEGKWTNFETAVWEKHEIEVYRALNPQLENDAEPLSKDTFARLKRFFKGC